MKKKEVVDSWDDEVSSGDEAESKDIVTDLRIPPATSPAPPPNPPAPTPAIVSPFVSDDNSGSYYAYDPNTHSRAGGYADSQMEGQRQAKTDAVVRRMIASALGVRSRSTQEQKEYEASLKQKMKEEKDERKKLEAEREKAKAAVWDD